MFVTFSWVGIIITKMIKIKWNNHNEFHCLSINNILFVIYKISAL